MKNPKVKPDVPGLSARIQLPMESLVRNILGFFLWVVSAILTAALFLSFSLGDPGRMVILILLAVGLEGSKILTWRMGGKAKILSWILIGLSVFASFGSALQTIRALDQLISTEEIHSAVLLTRDDERLKMSQDLDRQILDLESKRAALPETWLSWYRRFSEDLLALRKEKAELLALSNPPPLVITPNPTPSTIFHEIAEFTSWNRSALELFILLLMALVLEWSALALAGHPSRSVAQAPRKEVFQPELTEVFLQKMIELGDGEYLAGRDRVGVALRLSTYQSKKHYELLVRTGRIIKKSGRMMESLEIVHDKM